MAYKILENDGVDITNIDGAVLNNFSAGNRSGLVGGFLNECALSSTGNSIILSTGCLMLHGVRVKISEVESVVMSSTPSQDTRYQLIAQVIVDTAGKVEFSLFAQAVQSLIQNAFLVDGMGTYQLEIGQFTHTTSGTITDIVKTANVIYGASSIDINDIRNTAIQAKAVSTQAIATSNTAKAVSESAKVIADDAKDLALGVNEAVATEKGTVVTKDGNPVALFDADTKLDKGKETILVSDVFQSRITATNPIEILDSPLGMRTAEIISIKAPIGGVTNVTKLTSVGDNLVNVVDHDVVTNSQHYIDHNYGLVLLPNTEYRLNLDYEVISTTAPELYLSVGYGLTSFSYEISGTAKLDMVAKKGKITRTFTTPATFEVPSPVLFVREARSSSPHTSKVRISNIMVQFAVSPNTAYIPYKADYVDIPDKILRSNADGTSDEITPTQHIQRVDENNEKLAEPIYTPISWDNSYSAWNNGMETLNDTARIDIKYVRDISLQVETNTEMIHQLEKQIQALLGG